MLVACAVAIALNVGSVGCGPDGPDGPGARAADFEEDVGGRVLRAGDEVHFVASEFQFMPHEVVAEAGSYSGQLINEGSIKHNITFASGESFDAEPGDSVSIEFSVLAEDVTFFCAIEGHADAGMTGVIHAAPSTTNGDVSYTD
jgi:uncharacterized cupredoxin-like copper-binding protein